MFRLSKTLSKGPIFLHKGNQNLLKIVNSALNTFTPTKLDQGYYSVQGMLYKYYNT